MATSAEAVPLPKFHTVSHGVSVSHGTSSQRSTDSSPHLIILVSWMAASPRHVAKYLAHHRARHPDATIFHVSTSIIDAAFRPASLRRADLAPVIAAIEDAERASAPSAPRILLHLFSNGGAYSTHQLLLAFRAQTGRPLPASAVVLDSSPGRATFTLTLRAMRVSLARVFSPLREVATLVIALVLGVHRVLQALGMGDVVARAREGLNDTRFVKAGAARLYLYSRADDLVLPEDVEAHAKDGEERMGCVVRRVVFEDSGHAAHAVRYPERYWEAVDRVWKEAVGSES